MFYIITKRRAFARLRFQTLSTTLGSYIKPQEVHETTGTSTVPRSLGSSTGPLIPPPGLSV